ALVRLGRRDALVGGAADGLGLVVTGAAVTGVLAVAAHASATGHLDRVLIAMLALLALAAFEAVSPLAAAIRELAAIHAAGRRLREHRQEDVRRAIAVAGQDFYLFATSILENVRLARPEATDADIEDALRRARIWPWTQQLEDGWHTHVGEDGRALSGGQR